MAVATPAKALRFPTPSAVLLTALALIAAFLAITSVHNYRIASDYRSVVSQEKALVARTNQQVSSANREVAVLNSEVGVLSDQLDSTQGTLSSVASQKAKDVDLLKLAAQVAGDLNSCIDQANRVGGDASTALGAGEPAEASIRSEASVTDQVCGQAQTDNENLQSVINSTP